MKPRKDLLTAFVHSLLLVSCSAKLYPLALDNKVFCQSNTNIITRQLEDDDVIRIYGKKDDSNNFKECVIKLSPSSKAQKLTTAIKFDTFHINDCDTFLLVQQSPFQFFEKEVGTMFNFSCNSSPGKEVFHSEESNSIMIILSKGRHRNYNFLFNVTLTDYKPSSGISSAVIIATGILVAIAVPGIGCIIYRYMKIKNWSKRQCEMEEYSTQSVHRLTDPSYTPTSPRYSSMPAGDGDLGSQVCVVGSHGADGRCTVCHRSHEDFAHVVDFINDRPAPNDSSSSHRARDEHVHPTEGGAVAHMPPHLVDARSANRHSHSHMWPGSTSAGMRQDNSWLNDDDFDDIDDIDLSGNDLIPPSYDLVPPSYEEAVGMPKPQAETSQSVPDPTPHHIEETDPLYQNVESLTADVS